MKYSFLIKIILTIILIGVLLLKIDIANIITVFHSIEYVYLFPAIILVPLLYVIRAMRWKILLDAVGININLLHSFNLMMMGSFYGLISPGKIGEFGRVFHLNEKKTLSIATVMVEKSMDVAILIFLSLFTTIFYFNGNFSLVMILLTCCILGLFVFYLGLQESFLVRIGKILHFDQIMIQQYLHFVKGMIKDYPLMGKSVSFTLLYYFVAYVISLVIAVSANFLPITIISMPIVVLIGNIPLTISGIGIRESVGSMMFVQLGGTAADGFVFSLLLFLLITLIPGIWGYFLTMKREYL